MKNNLYIIGNGFDLHHNIQSSYSHFRDYIQNHNKALFDLTEEYFQIEDNWSDFESALATINTEDIDELIDNASSFLASYTDDDWSDASHHDYQYEIGKVFHPLSSLSEKYFKEWLLQTYIPNRKETHNQLLNLTKNATFLNFNYTNTLQKIYKIKKSKILHIHGSLKYPNSIVLGHSWKPTNNKYLDTPYDQGDLDVRVMEGNELIEQYFNSTFKPTKKIIKENKNFFSKLKKIDKIYVLGHSFSDIDFKYFQVIVKQISKKDVCWIVSYYTLEDKEKYKQQFKELKINSKNIKYTKLTKLTKR